MITGMNDLSLPVAPADMRRRPDGPPPGILATVALVLTIAGVVVPVAMSGSGFPTPASSAASTASYFAHHSWAGTLSGFFAFGASVPVGIYAATMYARQLRLGIRVPGPGISFFGGITASVLLAVSGLITWVLARASDGVAPATIHLLTDLGFAGGVGLLIAGIAVPGVILRLIPAWLAWLGLVLAALGEISFLALLWNGFDALLPVTRFGGLLWLTAVGFLFPRDRRSRNAQP
jgi:hypothetical protein